MIFCYKVYVEATLSWYSCFLIFGLPLYVLKHLIRYKMGSNLIYFIHLIQHTAIKICIIKNKYFENKVTYYISYSDWFSAIAFGFR